MAAAIPPGTRVAVVDDDPVFLRTLERFLSGAGLAVEAFRSAGDFLAHGAGSRPECVVLDLDMPGLSGLELQEALGAREEGPPVVFVSGMADVPASVKAMHRGAVDFLTKPFPRDELLAAIGRAVERTARRRAEGEERQALAARLARLSPRERQVCDLVVKGLLNKQIGAELGTSENTVKVHRSRAMHKLGASALPDLVRLLDRARELGVGGGKG